jgi:hypothetical protein
MNRKKFRPHLRKVNGHYHLVLSRKDLQKLLKWYPEDENEHIIVY